MQDVWVIGAHSTKFARQPERTFDDLTREAYLGVLTDAKLDEGGPIGMTWFANCAMATFGQPNIRGQSCFSPLVQEGLHPERSPIINVEGGCATGSMAFHAAVKDVLSGETDLSLAIGVEKTFVPDDPAKIFALFEGGSDLMHKHDWMAHFVDKAAEAGIDFAPVPHRILFLDTYAIQARHHMNTFGTTARQIAYGAAKNHGHGALNEKAQYRKAMTVEEVLADKTVIDPFTRAMCSPISDGAAALLVCGKSYLERAPAEVRDRAIRVRATSLSGGKYRELTEPSLTRAAADRSYERAGLRPEDIDVVELHDSTSFCEIYQLEMLRLCEEGQGGPFVGSGATELGGKLPVNPSGGLVSKGHPLAATGLSMLEELVVQLRGEAGDRQVGGAQFALQQNAGGLMGFDEAACSVAILSR